MTNPNLKPVPHPEPIRQWPESVTGQPLQNPRRSPLAEVNPHSVPNRTSTNKP
jgi:hypothetical protein